MAIKANGAVLGWIRYEFGIKDAAGDTWAMGTLEQAEAAAAHCGGEVVMRAVYATGWIETL